MIKEKKFWGQGIFNFVTILLQIVFIIAFVVNTIIIGYSVIRLAVDLRNHNLDNYYQTFYHPEEESSAISIENDWNNEELEMIEKGEISHGQVVAAAWITMITSEIYMLGIIIILTTARKFIKSCKESVFKEENLAMLKKMKRNLVMVYVVPLIVSILCVIFTSISIHYTLNLFILLAFYALFDFISYIIKQGINDSKKETKAA